MAMKAGSRTGARPDGLTQVKRVWDQVWNAKRRGVLETMCKEPGWPRYTKPGRKLKGDDSSDSDFASEPDRNGMPIEALIDDRGLGKVLRLILIREFCGDIGVAKFESSYRKAAEELSFNAPGLDPTLLPPLFNIASTKARARNGELRSPSDEALDLVMLNLVNQQRDHLSQCALKIGKDVKLQLFRDAERLFRWDFVGADAPDDYRRMLDGTWDEQQPMLTGREFVTGNKQSERSLFLTQVLEQVEGGESMLVNIYAPNMWNGLSAFAETLVRTLSDHDSRPILYLPLRRSLTRYRRRGKPLLPETLGLADLMGMLDQFTARRSAADVDLAEPINGESDFMRVLNEIRGRLTRLPYTIVIDGVFEPMPSSNAHIGDILESVVADNHVGFVLARLLEPLIGSVTTSGNDGLTIFARNRFIVTSNTPLRHVDGVAWIPGMRNRQFALPPADLAISGTRELILMSGVRRAVAVKNLFDETTSVVQPNDTLDLLLDAALGLVKQMVGCRDKARVIVMAWLDRGGSTSDDDAVGVVLSGLMQFIRESRRVWYETILVLALAPEGCRIETLQRLAVRASRLPYEHRPLSRLSEAEEEDTLVDEIHELVLVGEHFLGYLRTERFEGVDGVDHPAEFSEFIHRRMPTNSLGRERVERTIDLRLPETRQHLRRIAESDRGFLVRSVYRLHSELTLHHQIVGFRHAHENSYRSVRQWRRALSAIYHGLLSLEFENKDGRPCIRDIDYSAGGIDQATTASRYHLYLYVKCYRVAVEHMGVWRLSQQLGLDDLKIELLRLFDQPYLLRRDRSLSSFDLEAPGLLARYLEDGSTRHHLAIDHVFGLVHAYLARGAVRQAGRVIRLLEELVLPNTDVAKKFSDVNRHRYIKRRIDIDAQEFMLNTPTFWKEEIASLLGEPAERIIESAVGRYGGNLQRYLESAGAEPFPALIVDESVLLTEVECIDLGDAYPSVATQLMRASEILQRAAVQEANQADFSDSVFASQQLRHASLLVKRLPKGYRVQARRVDGLFCRSFARFLLSEHLRLMVFEQRPDGREFLMKGGQMRVAVRVALKLDRILQGRGFIAAGASPFEEAARQLADRLAMHTYPRPRDRAELLILESAIARGQAGRGNEAYFLGCSQSYLALAEELVTGMNQVARSRLRLALERARVHELLCRYHLVRDTDSVRTLHYLQLCNYDRASIDRIVQEGPSQFWRLLAYRQFQRLDVLEKDVANAV